MTPVNAVLVTSAITVLIGLISIGSPTAFSDLLSLTINGLYSSYLLVCALLLWRRCTGRIHTNIPFTESISNNGNTSRGFQSCSNLDTGPQLVWGPWRMPGVLGIICNSFACVFMVIITFFSFWPQGLDPTPATMNWSCLVTGAVAMLSATYYFDPGT